MSALQAGKALPLQDCTVGLSAVGCWRQQLVWWLVWWAVLYRGIKVKRGGNTWGTEPWNAMATTGNSKQNADQRKQRTQIVVCLNHET